MQPPMTQLDDHLWVAQSELYKTNSGIFLNQGQACLIDPCIYPHEIEALARFVQAQESVPVALILTHSHWDHILGPEHFPGVKVIAHESYITEVAQHQAEIQQQIADWVKAQNVERSQAFVIPQPDNTFAETIELTAGNLSLQLTHAPGHAADQLVVYQADSATLWAADMLSDLEIPFVSHNLAAYEHTLSTLSALDIFTLVPGHGQPSQDAIGIRARIYDDIAYLAELRGRVGSAVCQGKTLPETRKLCNDMRYRRPEQNSGPHRLNVESVYLELGGQADPTKVGWGQALS